MIKTRLTFKLNFNCLAIVFVLFSYSYLLAHVGHSHSSVPAASSNKNFTSAIDGESPLSINFKMRSGYEYGQFIGALPSLNSYFGNDEVHLNLNYEFRFREFLTEETSGQQSQYEDRDFNNYFSARIKKSLSSKLDFTITGEYETNQAVRIARMINDYNYTAVNSNLSYKMQNEWIVAANYLFGLRQFPNGTYLIPSGSSSGIGEPITPGEQISANEPITIEGVADNQNEMTLSASGELGRQTVTFEGRSILNNSDLTSRRYNAQAFRMALEKMLWNRVFGQVYYATENRIFSDRTDQIATAGIGLQKDLSARLSILGSARNNQAESVKNTSWWEGYAQLQYAF